MTDYELDLYETRTRRIERTNDLLSLGLWAFLAVTVMLWLGPLLGLLVWVLIVPLASRRR
jgi:hypothetical protein